MLAALLPLIVTVGIAVLAALMLWYTLAKTILFERDIHTLTVDAHSLQIEYAEKLANMRGDTAWGNAELVLDEREEAMLAKFAAPDGGDVPAQQAA